MRSRESFRADTRLASVMLANNVVGTIEPIDELARIAHEHGRRVPHRRRPGGRRRAGRCRELGVDLLSLSAHKFYGPKGIGALYVRRGTRIGAILHGGGHERRLRSGTENVPAHRRHGAALEIADGGDAPPSGRVSRPCATALPAAFWRASTRRFLLGHPSRRLPGNVCVTVRYVEGESMVLQLDAARVRRGQRLGLRVGVAGAVARHPGDGVSRPKRRTAASDSRSVARTPRPMSTRFLEVFPADRRAPARDESPVQQR